MKVSSVMRGQMKKPPWRVAFFGTDEFSLQVLQALFENRITKGSPSCVVGDLAIVHPYTKKMSPVQRYASHCDLSGFGWPLKTAIKRFDVGVLSSFGHLVPRRVIEMFPHGVINVHPSLLPEWRGAAPLHHSILSGSSRTGVSIMALKPKHFDVGPLLLQKEVPLPHKSTTFSLREHLAEEGGKMIIQVLSALPDYLEKSETQKEGNVCYAHKMTQAHSFLDWENQTMDQIDRQYRALHESMELRSVWEGKTVRMRSMVDLSVSPGIGLGESEQPGTPTFSKKEDTVWVKCKDGWVGFKSIVIKKPMSAASFYNGYLSKEHLKGAVFISVSNNLFDNVYHEWVQNPRPS